MTDERRARVRAALAAEIDRMRNCERTDPHDHADPRLPDWFHAWLRGERRHAPAMTSWKSQRPVEIPFGTVSGRTWTDEQYAAHGMAAPR